MTLKGAPPDDDDDDDDATMRHQLLIVFDALRPLPRREVNTT